MMEICSYKTPLLVLQLHWGQEKECVWQKVNLEQFRAVSGHEWSLQAHSGVLLYKEQTEALLDL